MSFSASIPPSMSSPRGDERRDELLRVAIDVFGEAGFAGGRIDEVARRVGIRRPSVLYHFPDKSTLYRAALARVVEEITARIVASESVREARLEVIVDSWIEFVIGRQWAARLLLRQMIDDTPGGAPDETLGPVATLLASLQRALDDRVGPNAPGRVEASEFALILSSTTLVWVASSRAVEDVLGLDTLAPKAVSRHRSTLRALVHQLVDATASTASTASTADDEGAGEPVTGPAASDAVIAQTASAESFL